MWLLPPNIATTQQAQPVPLPPQGIEIRRRHLKTASPFRKRIEKMVINRLLGWWSQNAPASSAYGARRAVLGR